MRHHSASTYSWIVVAIVSIAAIAITFIMSGATIDPRGGETNSRPGTGSASAVPIPPEVTSAQRASLPEARYDAVVPGLIPFSHTVDTATVFSVEQDTALFGSDRRTAIARLAALDFLGNVVVVVGVRREGPWELILTPARQALPSHTVSGKAAAQSAAWIPAASLRQNVTPKSRIVISTRRQTVSIVDTRTRDVMRTFPSAVGTRTTPTPTGVTGYLEERYVDSTQGTQQYPIQLTSLHSDVTDEPYGGNDGGLIGIHWDTITSGAVSHGCVRVNAPTIMALNELPLGTLVTIE